MPATQLDQVMTAMDVLPTLLAAAGQTLDPQTAIDGQNMWPALADGSLVPRREPIFFVSEIPIPGLIHLAVIDGPWKLVQVLRERPTSTQVKNFLYAIESDPNEQNDLAAAQPEQVKRLARLLRAWRRQHPREHSLDLRRGRREQPAQHHAQRVHVLRARRALLARRRAVRRLPVPRTSTPSPASVPSPRPCCRQLC